MALQTLEDLGKSPHSHFSAKICLTSHLVISLFTASFMIEDTDFSVSLLKLLSLLYVFGCILTFNVFVPSCSVFS
jgi:hypothetical protein